ncbi:alpha/beta fold hydrolase [Amycolatopsis carbonis]|uniref:Alpha/beta fold hydrolase n=1 Tax=Amycolatopsis carbonis TaxID=715471 RepID=A0A9Y2MXV0_9PSEU|nr:alpha/beta fold hydrolase [Amycolatopsis sp. 2-15]WIX79419.1 alpha/beta fold hydrolase [Amycolatopsis sp. 2-15]
MLTDLPLAQLRTYTSAYQAPEDFDEFWRETLAEAAKYEIDVTVTPVETALRTLDVFEVTYAGFGGHPIHAWLRVPRNQPGPLPAVVQFHGYGSGRGSALEELVWASAGYAQLQIDVRGQGGAHAGGTTGDPVGSGPSFPGFLTRGIESRETYFYRRVFTDAARAVEAARALDVVDADRVAVVGNSQGGGIALAAAALVPDVAALYAQAPFLCDLRRASLIAGKAPYTELAGYLATQRHEVDRTFEVLSYFDGVGFASRATAPAHFSIGLMDDVVPPSTVFGAYNAYRGRKHLDVWEYNGHEAGGGQDLENVLATFAPLLKPGS